MKKMQENMLSKINRKRNQNKLNFPKANVTLIMSLIQSRKND